MTDDLDRRERERVAPYVTDPVGPVFALTGLPEVVKGALFARYSRSPKSLRRLLLDEFLPAEGRRARRRRAAVGEARAEALYARVLAEYGDDSVAQLGGAHIAVEGASNLLTKVLQWGRLASYLEQSTRYIALHRPPRRRVPLPPPRDDRGAPGARAGVHGDAGRRLRRRTPTCCPAWSPTSAPSVPDDAGDPGGGPRARDPGAGARPAARAFCPAATTANVGIFASGQAYEAMLVRMAAHPLPEARECAARMLAELRKVIPAFLTRVDREDRGVAHGRYLRASELAAAELAASVLRRARPASRPARRVRLVDFDPDGEARVLAHALWPAGGGGARARSARRAAELAARSACPGARRLGRRRAATAASARAGRSRRRPTRSRSCATTAPTATCSATGCSPSRRSR